MNQVKSVPVSVIAVVAVFSGLLAATVTHAAQDSWNASVEKTMVDGVNYGWCMAKVSPTAASRGLDCSGTWVTFSCEGRHNAKAVGNSKFDTARLALLQGSEVFLVVTDLKKHNGFCFVNRIDGLPDS